MAPLARKRAWETRRAKYGSRGHGSNYGRPCATCATLKPLIVRLHNEGILTEGQAAKALCIGRIQFRVFADELAKEG